MILKLYSSILQTFVKFLFWGLGLQKQTYQTGTPAFMKLIKQDTQGVLP